MRPSCLSLAIVGAVLVAVTVAAYWPVFWCGLIDFDDPSYVSANPFVLNGLSPTDWAWAWTTFHSTNWHPLTWLSLQLDSTVWGPDPFGYHLTNLMLHVANCVLLFTVSHQFMKSLAGSACIAALFALHPLHVESVAWVSERKDVLSTFFLLLTIMAYFQYALRPSVTRYLFVLAPFGLGLLAKPMLVTAPILLLLLDIWPLRRLASRAMPSDSQYDLRIFRRLLIEKMPLLCLAFADGLMTMKAQTVVVSDYGEIDPLSRLTNFFNAIRWYLQKTFIPTNLTIFYPHPEHDFSWMHVIAGVLVFCSISAFVFWRRKQSPHLFVGWSWFMISLLPVIGMIQVGGQAYADRYAYIPHLGLFIAIVYELQQRLSSTKVGLAMYGVFALAAVSICGLLTRTQVGCWKDSETVWAHALAVNPENGPACAHLADLRLKQGEYEQALSLIDRAMRLKRPGNIAAGYCAWGRALTELGRAAEAEQKFLDALKVDRDNRTALDELVKLLRSQGRHNEAAKFAARLDQMMAIDAQAHPETAAAQVNLGVAQARQGNIRQAIIHFQKAVQLDPKSATVRFNLAYAQMQLQHFSEAKKNLLKTLELDPQMGVAHASLAQILEAEQDFPAAKSHFQEALRINPADVEARQGLDRLSTSAGNAKAQ